MAAKKTKKRDLTELEMNGLIRMIKNDSYDDNYVTDWDGRVTFIGINEDFDGCSAYYGFDEDGPRHSVEPPYENHTLEVANITLEFKNYGEGNIIDLKISEDSEYTLPNGELQDELLSAIVDVVNDYVEYGGDGSEQFEHDWTHDEIVEEIESNLMACEYIKKDEKIYPADDWDKVIKYLFDGEEPNEDAYTSMVPHEVAEELADKIDCY